MDDSDFFGPYLPKNRYWGRNFKNLNRDFESASPRYHECQFPVKMDNFEFFGLPNYVPYFGSNNVECVAESLMKAEISCVKGLFILFIEYETPVNLLTLISFRNRV